MSFQLDHLFVCTHLDAPEAARLASAGLTEGRSGVHKGQGTANRCFLFRNAYLELIWVHAPEEARSELTARTRLFERWSGRADGTCPFGICLRSADPAARDQRPFNTWDYLPLYAPASAPIRIGTNSDRLDEPMLFFLDGASRPDTWPWQPDLQHPLGLREVTRLKWTRPADAPLSPELQAVVAAGCLDVELGRAHAIELGFDNETASKNVNFLPDLPVTLRW